MPNFVEKFLCIICTKPLLDELNCLKSYCWHCIAVFRANGQHGCGQQHRWYVSTFINYFALQNTVTFSWSVITL